LRLEIDSPPTIVWVDDRVEILDQALLPTEVRTVELRSVDDIVHAIGRLAIRGAPAIGACGAFGVVLAIDESLRAGGGASPAEIGPAVERIAAARPTAVNLRWAVERVVTAVVDLGNGDERREAALSEATAIFEEDRSACDSIGRHGAKELADASVILTHCNAGRLAQRESVPLLVSSTARRWSANRSKSSRRRPDLFFRALGLPCGNFQRPACLSH